MANFTKRTKTVTYTEYLIPRGSHMDEWDKAATVALREYEAANGPSKFDDWAQIDCDDEHIIIRITTEKVTPA